MYQGQTPQSFKLNKLKIFYDKLTNDEKIKLTDACKLFVANGEEVAIVKGEEYNIKITYTYDLKVANCILKGDFKWLTQYTDYTLQNISNKTL